MTLDQAIVLALKALKQVIETELDSTKVEVALARTETKEFERLATQELDKYIKDI